MLIVDDYKLWRGDFKYLIKIYNATIQSKINYASILYRTAAKSTLKLIDTVNNSGLRLAIGTFRSSPTLSIYNIAGIPPPTLIRIELSIKNIARLASRNGVKYSNINNEIAKLTNEIEFSSVKIIPRESYIAPLGKQLPNQYRAKRLIQMEHSPRDI